MLTLFKKEINNFLSSLIGYIVIGVFLVLVSLFLFIFPNEFNLLKNQYASLDALFTLAPWVFLILIPAVTMRSFSEEKRTGTIELLKTKPLTSWQIILAKYLAGFVLVLIALLPTLIYFYTIYQLGSPVGNIDLGETWGSYFGLVFLAAGFVAIGIFASSVTQNQVVAFIIAVFFCFFCFIGFESIGSYELLRSIGLQKLDNFIINLGINEHYISMSRGVIDTRDILYFLSLVGVFLYFTKLNIDR